MAVAGAVSAEAVVRRGLAAALGLAVGPALALRRLAVVGVGGCLG